MSRRVLYITGEYPPMHGGIADYTRRLADTISSRDWEPRIMTSNEAGTDQEGRILAHTDKWDSRIFEQVRVLLTDYEIDLIHIQYQTGAFQMRPSINFLPLRLGLRNDPVPIVTTYHDLLRPYLFPKAGRLRRWANRALALGSDAVILTNERDYRQVSRVRRLRNRLHRIPIGSNIPPAGDVDRDAVLRRHGLDPSGFVIGFFGFLTPDKGFSDLLDALERPDMSGTELLVISGELATTDTTNRRYHQQVQRRIENAKIPVKRTGYLPLNEVSQALAAVDVIALPYRTGASLRSGTLIAALQSGTPVVTTDPRDNDSLAPLVPGESIWLVPISEPDVLHEAIQILQSEPSLRKSIACKAREQTDVFDWERIADRHIDLYQTLLDQR